jgi:hypothetical protein
MRIGFMYCSDMAESGARRAVTGYLFVKALVGSSAKL